MIQNLKPLLLAALVVPCANLAYAEKWTFMVYGDTRGNGGSDQINIPILTELVRVTVERKPAFVLIPGDLVNSGNAAVFRQWTNIMSPIYQAGIQVYPVMGSHDAADVKAYKTTFGQELPDNGPAGEIDLTYAITYSNSLVLALDTNLKANRINQAWVDSVLATNTRPHIFAMAHVPAFKVNHTDCLDDYPTNRNAFWNSLTAAGCRLYFVGHDHFYDHMRLDNADGNPNNDLHQVIVGTGGAPFYADGPYNGNNGPWTPTRVLHEQQYGYLRVEVDGNNVTSTWYHRTSADAYAATSDVFSYTVMPEQPTLGFAYAGGRLTLTWPSGSTLQTASEPNGTYTDVAEAASPYVITRFDEPLRFFRVRMP